MTLDSTESKKSMKEKFNIGYFSEDSSGKIKTSINFKK